MSIATDIITGDEFVCQWDDGVFGIQSNDDETENSILHLRTGFGIDIYTSKQVAVNFVNLLHREYPNIDDLLYDAAFRHRDRLPQTPEFLSFCQWANNKRRHPTLIPMQRDSIVISSKQHRYEDSE